MARRVAITTIDNPHDPVLDFPAWFAFDVAHHYNTTALLARLVISSDELSEPDQDDAVETAIDEMIQENVSGVYRKVVHEID